MPPIKELRFLNEGNELPHYNLKNLLLNSHWHYKELRRILASRIIRQACSSNQRFSWFLKYYFQSHTFSWYSSLFPKDKNLVCGDISPLYYRMPESKIARLSQYNKATKVLIFIRNPIDRVWSKALMNLCANQMRKFEAISYSEFIEFFDDVHYRWNPYITTVNLWKKYFPNVYLGSYETLKGNPAFFFKEVCDFLEIDGDVIPSSVNKRVNAGIGKEIPSDLLAYLKNQYSDEIHWMAEFGYCERPESWLKI